MPTRNRRAFVGQAIAYFQRQDYPARELIIVDDGDDPVGDLIPPDDPRIRYVALPQALSYRREAQPGLRVGAGGSSRIGMMTTGTGRIGWRGRWRRCWPGALI